MHYIIFNDQEKSCPSYFKRRQLSNAAEISAGWQRRFLPNLRGL